MNISRPFIGICCQLSTILPWITALVICSPNTFAQPVAEWDRDFGGNNWEELNSIQQTSDNGYIMAGYSSSSLNGDISEATNGLGDFWLMRTDENGNALWDKRYGGNGEERPYSVKETADGGFILGGWSFSGISGDKTQASRGYFDYWIVKTDTFGNLEWDRTYGGDSTEYLYDLIQTNDGGYLLGGISMSGVSGEKTGAGRGDFDFWIIKTDAGGNIEWDRTYGGNEEERLNNLLEDEDGHFILAGGSRSDIGGEVTTGLLGVKDFWMLKVDRINGNIIWERRYGGTDEDEISSVVKTSDGGYLMGGGSRSDQLSGRKTENSRGIVDMWVVKTDAAGNIEWDRTFGGVDLDNCYSVKQNSIGYYLIGGYSGSPAGGDKTEASRGGYDYWLIYLDPNGNKLWDKTLGGSGNDVMENLFQTSDGGYLMGGHSSSGADGDKTAANKGLNDFWIVKTSCNLSVEFRDTSVCPDQAVTLNAYDPSCVDCRWIWNDGNTDSVRTIFTTTDLTYQVTLTDGVGCARFDDIQITVNQPPDIELGNDYSICAGTSTTLDAGVPNLKYNWSTGDTLPQIQTDTAGRYSLLVTDANGCTDEDSIRIFLTPLPLVALGPDTTLCPGQSLPLDAGNPGASFRWSGNQNSQVLNVSNPGSYAVTVTDQNGCSTSDTILVTAYDPPQIQNPETVCNPENTHYILSFSIENGDTSTYLVNGLNGRIANGRFISDPIPKDQSYSVFLSDARGCDPTVLSGSFDCNCLSTAPNLRNDPLRICGDEEAHAESLGAAILDSNDVVRYVLHEGPAGALGNIIAENQEAVFTFLPGMTYGRVYYISAIAGNRDSNGNVNLNDGCLSVSNGVPVTFYEYPQSQIIPQGMLILNCDFPTLMLDGNSSQSAGNLSFLWQTAGEGNILGNTAAAQVEVNAGGTYLLIVTDQISGCKDTASISITADNELPLAQIAAAEELSCVDTLLQLDASASTSGPGISYLWQGGSIDGSTLQNPVVDQPGRYTLLVTDSTNGCTAMAFIDVEQNIEPPQVEAGTTAQLDCLSNSIELQGSYSADGEVEIMWSTLQGNILSGAQSLHPEVDQTGIYELQIIDLENGCVASDEVLVISDPDVPSGATIRLQQPSCYGEEDGSILIESVFGGRAPFVYALDNSPASTGNAFGGLAAGEYLLTIEDANGCRWDTLVMLEAPAVFVASLNASTVIQIGGSVDLRPQFNLPLSSFRWISTDSSFCTNCLNPTVSPQKTTVYRLELTNTGGCTVSVSITIGVRNERLVYIPTAFTPNLDGINDRLVVYGGKGVARIKAFRIFDRWGALVFELLDAPPNVELSGWDGRLNGEMVNSGVYVYYAEIEFTDGWTEMYKGDISLMR